MNNQFYSELEIMSQNSKKYISLQEKYHTENIDSYIQSLHTKIKQLENNLPTDQQKPDFVKPLNHIIQGFSEIISQIDHL